MNEYQHPYETVNLPSGGRFYPENHPLKGGTIDIKYLTAKEEDILTSTNLIRNNMVIEKLLESIIVQKEEGPRIRVGDMVLSDVDAIIVAARVLAYGREYPVRVTCTSCGAQNQVVYDLASVENRETDKVNIDANGFMTYQLNNDITLQLKVLTWDDDKHIRKELQNLSNKNLPQTEVTSRLRSIIVSVNGDTNRSTINEFVGTMLLSDSRKLRKDYVKLVPGLDFSLEYTCQQCQSHNEGGVVIDQNFFWPEL